ncbi:lantibiotic dehydratase [Streptomyces sp. NPDC058773]|uniref:lantibiotic dehydratase n=1 Tax=Streptomyces sp. NPDC058773 TaxID=3346632 RepID=UPI0036A798A4
MAVNLHLDAEVQLPHAGAREAETETPAATVRARLTTHPDGTPAGQTYRHRFLEDHGPHVLIPLLECTDPVTGIDLPDGFHTAASAA